MSCDDTLIFVDIDTQRDFLDPSGVLRVPGADSILDNLARLTNFARERGIPVLATACAHEPGDPEFEQFPPHCLIGTWGHERIDATRPSSTIIVGLDKTPLPGSKPPPHATLHKTSFDLFERPDADLILAPYTAGSPIFVVYGVATDYCVRCAVNGLLDRGHRVALVVDAVRAVNPDDEPAHLTDLARRGAQLTLTSVICATGS